MTPGIRFALIAMVFFAVQDAVSTHLAAHYPVPFFVMIRYWVFAGFVLAVSARRPGGVRQAAQTALPLIQCLRGVLLVVQILVIVTAFRSIGLAPTHALFALYPLIATALAVPMLGERVGWRRLGAVLAGFAGMLVILRPGAQLFEPEALIAVLAALLLALYSVLTRMANAADGHARASFFYTGMAGAIAISLVGPFHWSAMSLPDLGWLALLSLAGLAGHYCLIRALDLSEAVAIQPFVYLQMVFGMVIGWSVFGDRMDGWMLLGTAIIVGAGLYSIWRERRSAVR